MKILFVHQNFPGQFKALAPALAGMAGVSAAALSMRPVPEDYPVQPNIHQVTEPSRLSPRDFASDFETKMLRAHSALRAAEQMRAAGFIPDIIIGHPGWGEMHFLRLVWPDARQLHFLEFFYHTAGLDIDFDPEFAIRTNDHLAKVSAKRASPLLALAEMDWGLSPTQWQKETYPRADWPRISVIHDGVDTRAIQPNPQASIGLANAGLTLRPGDPVVTFVNRNLEPYRGYHIFMRTLPEVLSKNPAAQIVIVGGESVSYGAPPQPGQPSWKQQFLDEVKDKVDLRRVHFVGNIPYLTFLTLLQVSAVHVYLTYPFVLSWSLLEAMATECLIIGSRTAPVMEVVKDGRHGVLVDFFDSAALAAAILDGLHRPDAYRAMRAAARQKIVENYDLATVCLPAQIKLVHDLYEGQLG